MFEPWGVLAWNSDMALWLKEEGTMRDLAYPVLAAMLSLAACAD